jgi:hypothetical protein
VRVRSRRLPAPASGLRGVLSVKDVAWMLFCLIRNELQGCAPPALLQRGRRLRARVIISV